MAIASSFAVAASSIWWVVLWSGVTLAGLAGAVASTNSIRFQRRVTGEARSMLAATGGRQPVDRAALESVPAPVRRYLTKAIGPRGEAVRTARLQQDGAFRPALSGSWYPLKAAQYFTADPPGFLWWGRVRLTPGIWMEARDRSIGGAGNMLVVAESIITLADAAGPELDQGALLRLLGELMWLPTAYLDDRYIRWSAIDERHAKATLTVTGCEVTGVFEFGDDDLPAKFTAERFRDVGGGRSVLTPFLGESSDYREVDGLLVPHQMAGLWVIDGTPMPYALFHVTRIEFDVKEPF